MGSFILVGGAITKRLAFPHAWRQWVDFSVTNFFHTGRVNISNAVHPTINLIRIREL
ncbi:hypothetical protein Ddye_032614 [Dipteronia dyeriana]|uniref:Uncharacterized protein n=1 Tax=Dipteronia dyeriana TaxID=168575 RepID=A0AAD9TDE7_9ROSI|nr:hypothetical protein Ddye_032614 [Dipteronia dyeriana]